MLWACCKPRAWLQLFRKSIERLPSSDTALPFTQYTVSTFILILSSSNFDKAVNNQVRLGLFQSKHIRIDSSGTRLARKNLEETQTTSFDLNDCLSRLTSLLKPVSSNSIEKLEWFFDQAKKYSDGFSADEKTTKYFSLEVNQTTLERIWTKHRFIVNERNVLHFEGLLRRWLSRCCCSVWVKKARIVFKKLFECFWGS